MSGILPNNEDKKENILGTSLQARIIELFEHDNELRDISTIMEELWRNYNIYPNETKTRRALMSLITKGIMERKVFFNKYHYKLRGRKGNAGRGEV